jgi:hypothetical protein
MDVGEFKKMISICVPFYPWNRGYDRSEEVFDVLVKGLNNTSHAKSIELCLTDAGTEDIWSKRGAEGRKWDHEKFYKRLKDSFRGRLSYLLDKESVHVDEYGNRRFWLAQAVVKSVRRASYDNILIFGIDCYAPRDIVQRFMNTVEEGIGWVLFSFNIPKGAPIIIVENMKGCCWHTAKGIVGIKKSDYDKIGGYEKSLPLISTRTDSDFYLRMQEGLRKVMVRKEVGLFHINHKGSNASRIWRIEDAQ